MSNAWQIAEQLRYIDEKLMFKGEADPFLSSAHIVNQGNVQQILNRWPPPLGLISILEGTGGTDQEWEMMRSFKVSHAARAEDDTGVQSLQGNVRGVKGDGRGIIEMEEPFLAKIRNMGKTNGIEARIIVAGMQATEEVPEVGDVSFVNYIIEARCTKEKTFESIPRLRLTESGGLVTVKWTNVFDRFDRALPKLVFKSGSAPTTPTDGTVIPITAFTPATKTFSPGSGTFFVAIFAEYLEFVGATVITATATTRSIIVP